LNIVDLPHYVTVFTRNGNSSAKISSLLVHKRLGSHTESIYSRAVEP